DDPARDRGRDLVSFVPAEGPGTPNPRSDRHIRPLTKRLLLMAALAPVAVVRAVHVSRHADAGITVTPNVREFLATLTERDIQTMNKWKWSAYRHQDSLAVRIACEEMAEKRRDTQWENRVVF